MLDRRARQVGVQLIETAMAKVAEAQVTAPSLESLKAKKPQDLEGTPTRAAHATLPKVLTVPI
jgi:hypothetical protein